MERAELRTEAIAGITTFFTMSYIIFVNPTILATEGTGMSFSGFIPCLFIAPIAGMVPPYATAPVLILVGAFMFRSVTRLSMEKLEDAIPAFLTLILIPLTFSITQGLLWGFISHAALYTMAGR